MTGWHRCSSQNGERCSECGSWVKEVWKYWKGITCIKVVCVSCAETTV